MDWQLLDTDRELWDRELESFVPPRIFDAHAHLYEMGHFTANPPRLCASGPAVAGWETFEERIGQITPRRQTGGLFFGFPATHVDFAKANEFVATETRRTDARGQMLIHPSMDPEFIRATVRRDGFVGLKPYHLFAAEKPTWEAAIPSYLPEAHVRIAHELGLSITLHIVRARALADESNQTVLRTYAERYPNARLILAHAGRGFNPHHTIVGIETLRGLPNIWCDTSAVTDCGAFEAIIRTFGHRRLLYGSDFPVSHIRGRCVALGDSFLWLNPENTKLDAAYAKLQFSLVGLESLRTLKVAALATGLTDPQVEDIFFGNAARMFDAQ
jgi:glutamate-1-semialdehyde 2,1-aminomutase